MQSEVNSDKVATRHKDREFPEKVLVIESGKGIKVNATDTCDDVM